MAYIHILHNHDKISVLETLKILNKIIVRMHNNKYGKKGHKVSFSGFNI